MLPELLRVGGDRDVAAIGALVVGVSGGAAALEAALLAGAEELVELLRLHRDHAADEGAVDVLADAVALADEEGAGDAEGEEHGTDLVGEAADQGLGVAAGRLDLDDLGAHVAEEEGREGPLLVLGEVEHAHAVQGGASLRRTGGIGVL